MKLFIILALAVASTSAASLNTISKFGFSEDRVINGQNAVKGEAPYMVSLQRLYQHICGGSLLSPNWIVTAAHCLDERDELKAVVGIHRLSDSLLVERYRVTKKIQHENYTGGVGPYDIGLCFVKKSIILNDWVRTIGLPLNALHDTGDGKLYGFGYDNSGKLSNTLQVLNVNISDYDECKKYWPTPPLDPTNICTRKANTADSACSGDSGGPLVRYNDNIATLVGIVSWGIIPCGKDSAPTAYTRVSAYIDWIEDKINSNSIAPEELKLK